MLKRSIVALAAVSMLAAGPIHASDGNTDDAEVQTFATLPDGVRYPEGIAANPATGNIYVGTFDARTTGANNKLLRFGADGNLIAMKDFGGQPLLGLGFANNQVYILNFGASKVQRIAANFNAASLVEDVASIPTLGPPGPRPVPNPDGSSDVITFGANFPAPNALVLDHDGNMYVSDSFQGVIWFVAHATTTTCVAPCPAAKFTQDPLLATAGFPPFGANGVAFNADESVMYIANTGDNRVLAMDMGTKAITVFAESVHGADGLLFDGGTLWVNANQGDELVALNNRGRLIARVGSFDGIRDNGSPRGLLFPASTVILGSWMYVTNLALPLTPAVGDEPEEDVTRWNVARVRNPLRH